MKIIGIDTFFCGIALFGLCSLHSGEAEKAAPLKHELDFRIQNEKEWEAGKQDIEKVLRSSATELWLYFPERKLPPILIWAKGGPITLFERGSNGEIKIKLNTGGLQWAQYAYQCAHEMCHVLCDGKAGDNPNHWFEESLCEMASNFVLRKMAHTWRTYPPYANWSDYAKSLNSYANERLAQAKVPDGKTFIAWFKENEGDMRLNSTDRARNSIVAGVLLPLFESEPDMWEAATYLNREKWNKLVTLKEYLQAWKRNCPEKERWFIDAIAERFEIVLEK